MAEIKITKDNFAEKVVNQSGYVLLDFWASWCGPCKMLAPILSEIAETNPDIVVGKVNVDEEMELSQIFKIESIPTLLLFKDGKPVQMSVGYTSKENIEKMWK